MKTKLPYRTVNYLIKVGVLISVDFFFVSFEEFDGEDEGLKYNDNDAAKGMSNRQMFILHEPKTPKQNI